MGIDSQLRSSTKHQLYQHAEREPIRNILRILLKEIGFRFLARIDRVEGYENIPKSGPTIVLINHIAFIDPIAVINVYPRNLIPMAKQEVYEYPIISILPHIWGVITVNREGVDRQALRKSEEVLNSGEVILIAPEGTRSPALQQPHHGISFLAVRTNAPILPVAIDGTEGYPTYPLSKRWRLPGAVIRFGKPFRFRSDALRPDRDQYRQMTDEAMIVLAQLLPVHRRGIYKERVMDTLDTIVFIDELN